MLEDFEDKVREYESETKSAEDDERQQLEQLQARSRVIRNKIGVMEEKLASTKLAGDLRQEIERYSSLADSVLVVEQRDLSSADHVARLRIDIEDLSRDLESYVASSSRVAELEREFGDHEIDDVVNNIDAEMREAETAGEKARSSAENAREALTLAKGAAERMDELAALALPLLSDRCPVCEQTIDKEAVLRSLQERTKSAAGIVSLERAASDASKDVETAERQLAELKTRRVAAITQREELTNAVADRSLAAKRLHGAHEAGAGVYVRSPEALVEVLADESKQYQEAIRNLTRSLSRLAAVLASSGPDEVSEARADSKKTKWPSRRVAT